jgi:hypothetical protein
VALAVQSKDRAVEIDLGSAALRHMRDCFPSGKTLSHLLLDKADLARGRLFTALPHRVDPAALEQFDKSLALRGLVFEDHLREIEELRARGGPYMVRKPDMIDDLVDRVLTFLAGGQDRLCIMENPLAEATDPWLAEFDETFLTLGPDVYHVLDGTIREPSTIEWGIRSAFTSFDPPLVGVLTCGSVESSGSRTTTTAELGALAARATTIFMTAYRGEAFLYWTSR